MNSNKSNKSQDFNLEGDDYKMTSWTEEDNYKKWLNDIKAWLQDIEQCSIDQWNMERADQSVKTWISLNQRGGRLNPDKNDLDPTEKLLFNIMTGRAPGNQSLNGFIKYKQSEYIEKAFIAMVCMGRKDKAQVCWQWMCGLMKNTSINQNDQLEGERSVFGFNEGWIGWESWEEKIKEVEDHYKKDQREEKEIAYDKIWRVWSHYFNHFNGYHAIGNIKAHGAQKIMNIMPTWKEKIPFNVLLNLSFWINEQGHPQSQETWKILVNLFEDPQREWLIIKGILGSQTTQVKDENLKALDTLKENPAWWSSLQERAWVKKKWLRGVCDTNEPDRIRNFLTHPVWDQMEGQTSWKRIQPNDAHQDMWDALLKYNPKELTHWIQGVKTSTGATLEPLKTWEDQEAIQNMKRALNGAAKEGSIESLQWFHDHMDWRAHPQEKIWGDEKDSVLHQASAGGHMDIVRWIKNESEIKDQLKIKWIKNRWKEWLMWNDDETIKALIQEFKMNPPKQMVKEGLKNNRLKDFFEQWEDQKRAEKENRMLKESLNEIPSSKENKKQKMKRL